MIDKWSITIPELSGDEPRNVYVYLPDCAEEDPELRFPVLYMFDGHNVFFDEDATYGKSWGMQEYAEDSELPLIIAAVECTHDPNNGRLSEYSPFTFSEEGFGRIKGRGQQTMEWMINTFKPMIDENYPTLPDREHSFIAGSSMGGLMSLYAVTKYNHVFSRAAALSPSVWAGGGRLDRMLREAEIAPGTVVYMDYGENELNNHADMLHRFSRVASILMERGVLLNCRIVPGGDHCEASWERQIPFFMDTLFYGLE